VTETTSCPKLTKLSRICPVPFRLDDFTPAPSMIGQPISQPARRPSSRVNWVGPEKKKTVGFADVVDSGPQPPSTQVRGAGEGQGGSKPGPSARRRKQGHLRRMQPTRLRGSRRRFIATTEYRLRAADPPRPVEANGRSAARRGADFAGPGWPADPVQARKLELSLFFSFFSFLRARAGLDGEIRGQSS